MFDRAVKKPEDVISDITFLKPLSASDPSSTNGLSWEQEQLCQDLFPLLLTRYLNGPGHPRGPPAQALDNAYNLTPAEMSTHQGDPALRSRLFLEAVTGTQLRRVGLLTSITVRCVMKTP